MFDSHHMRCSEVFSSWESKKPLSLIEYQIRAIYINNVVRSVSISVGERSYEFVYLTKKSEVRPTQKKMQEYLRHIGLTRACSGLGWKETAYIHVMFAYLYSTFKVHFSFIMTKLLLYPSSKLQMLSPHPKISCEIENRYVYLLTLTYYPRWCFNFLNFHYR